MPQNLGKLSLIKNFKDHEILFFSLTDLIEQYDRESDTWTEYSRLKEPTFWHGSVSVFRFIQAPMSPDYQSNFFH